MFTPRSGAFKRPNRLALTLSANNRPEARNLDTNAPTSEADLFHGAEVKEAKSIRGQPKRNGYSYSRTSQCTLMMWRALPRWLTEFRTDTDRQRFRQW